MTRRFVPHVRVIAIVLLLGLGTGCRMLFRAAGAILGGQSSTVDHYEGEREGECQDGIDNDGDGAIDCEDIYCVDRPVCDPRFQDQAAAAARTAKAQEGVGGMYKATCDRTGGAVVGLDGETCSFTCGNEAVSYTCSHREARGMLTINVRPTSRSDGDPSDQLLLRVVDANTLVMDGNIHPFCDCGTPPRLVFKRDR